MMYTFKKRVAASREMYEDILDALELVYDVIDFIFQQNSSYVS